VDRFRRESVCYRTMTSRLALVGLSVGAVLAGCAAEVAGRRVVLVTVDGVRWQEVFRGADPALGSAGPGGNTAEEKRRALMPFLWGTVARQGQIFGNADRGSRVAVANPFRVSYPGYHELLCGFSSALIRNNLRIPNPDRTVLEWLHGRPGFAGSVAAYTSWDVFAEILGGGRGGLVIDVGKPSARPTVIERLRAEARPPWKDSVYDAFVFHAAMDYLRAHEPRVLYLALGDTDEWAHAGNYERYLDSVTRADRWLQELWEAVSSHPAYRGRTSLIVTTDHGRGDGPEEWGKHGAEIVGAEAVWIALIGPEAPPLGERQNHQPLTLSQVAATVGALVGEDFTAASGQVAPPLPYRGMGR
jgi:hypothetical protein